jgi:Raf kinase inhibitor-like YbhB/YbcL family protein
MGVLALVASLSAACADDAPAREPSLDASMSASLPEAAVMGASGDAAATADAASSVDARAGAPSDASVNVVPDAGRDTGASPDASTHDASAAADAGDASAPSGTFSLTSSVVRNNELLPAKYRCSSGGGTGPSFPLAWSGAPARTQSFALLMHDRTFMNYQHWTLYDVPATETSLPEGVPAGATTMPAGAKQAANSRGLTGPGYFGPCGMSGMNTYELTLYALDVATLPNPGTTGTSVEMALMGHVLGMTSLSVKSGPP